MRLHALRVLACCALLAAGTALAQDFPSKPLRIIIHVSPGSGTDLMTRAIGTAMGTSLGQSVVLENRPGASGLVAYEYVAKQVPADGYTLVTGGGSHATLKVFVKDLRFDPMKDLIPVSLFGDGAIVLAASAGAPFNTFQELVAYAKANPGKVTFGTSGFTTSATLNTNSLRQRYGIEITDVPYSGNSPARVALMAGTIHLLWHTEGEYIVDAAGPQKRVKAILVTSAQRMKQVPEVPTATELGHPELVGFYYGLSVPGATPRPVVERLYGAIANALKQPSINELAARGHVKLTSLDPEASKNRLQELYNNYAAIAAKAGIKPK